MVSIISSSSWQESHPVEFPKHQINTPLKILQFHRLPSLPWSCIFLPDSSAQRKQRFTENKRPVLWSTLLLERNETFASYRSVDCPDLTRICRAASFFHPLWLQLAVRDWKKGSASLLLQPKALLAWQYHSNDFEFAHFAVKGWRKSLSRSLFDKVFACLVLNYVTWQKRN